LPLDTDPDLARDRRRYWSYPLLLAPADRVAQGDIYGMFNVKMRVRDLLTIINDWDGFAARGVRLPCGLLLNGPPGHGKTMATRWLLSEATVNAYDVRDFPVAGEELTGRDLRALWAGARAVTVQSKAPVILIWEEISPSLRDPHLVAALKTEMDGLRGQEAPVVVVATANDLEGVDPALLRAGRFGLVGYCQPIAKSEQRRLLTDHLSRAALPLPPERALKNLLAGGASAAAIVEMVERVRLRAALVTTPTISEATVARLLVEQRFPIPDDRDDDAVEEMIAWHETGHGLACYALGLDTILINLCDLGDVEGSVWHAEERLPTYLDGFCSIVVSACGKAMERFIFGEENVTMHSSGGDYLSIAEDFMHLIVTGGGSDGKRFDWHAMQQAMSGNATTRHSDLDSQAQALAAIVGDLAYALLAAANAALVAQGTTLHAAFLPFIRRLVEERIILGADLEETISTALALPHGFFRTTARDAWARFERQEPTAARAGDAMTADTRQGDELTNDDR
jgi:hypothetical protein